MAFTVITEPSKYMAAYSPIPYRFEDSEVIAGNVLNYVAYLAINPVNITNITITAPFPNLTYRITTDSYHNLKVGDSVLMYNGNWVAADIPVDFVITKTQFLVKGDIGDDVGFFRPTKCGKSLLYIQSPNIKGEAEFDFSNVLRDFVKSEYRDWFIFPDNAVETKVRYSVVVPQYVIEDDGVGNALLYDSGDNYAYVGRQNPYEYDIGKMFQYVKKTSIIFYSNYVFKYIPI